MKSFNLQGHWLRRGRLVIRMISFSLQRQPSIEKHHACPTNCWKRVCAILFRYGKRFFFLGTQGYYCKSLYTEFKSNRNQDKQHHHSSHWRAISLYFLSMETADLRQPYGVQNSTIHTSASNRSPVGDTGPRTVRSILITIYGPMIYTAPRIRILMRADG